MTAKTRKPVMAAYVKKWGGGLTVSVQQNSFYQNLKKTLFTSPSII
jgi:hypothetical protein